MFVLRKLLPVVLCAIGLSVVGGVQAEGVTAAPTVVQSHLTEWELSELPRYPIGTYEGRPGESLDAFLYQMRPVLRAYANKTRFEPCGELAKSGTGSDVRYGIVLASTHSHIGCLITTTNVPVGFTAMGITYHAHGGTGSVIMSNADAVLLGYHGEGGGVRPTIAGQDVNAFSRTDFLTGAGYLATPTRVIYQDGNPRSVVVVPDTSTAASVAVAGP
ncbi:MAG TPA: hypothetical protein VF292_07415 [Rhodanobacteraceae bacterium]